jgi:hypothetical protein
MFAFKFQTYLYIGHPLITKVHLITDNNVIFNSYLIFNLHI